MGSLFLALAGALLIAALPLLWGGRVEASSAGHQDELFWFIAIFVAPLLETLVFLPAVWVYRRISGGLALRWSWMVIVFLLVAAIFSFAHRREEAVTYVALAWAGLVFFWFLGRSVDDFGWRLGYLLGAAMHASYNSVLMLVVVVN